MFLATKFRVYLVKEPADFDSNLNLQLEKLQTKHIDFYLLHALNGQRWQDCKEQQVFDFIQRAKADGRINIGTFHPRQGRSLQADYRRVRLGLSPNPAQLHE